MRCPLCKKSVSTVRLRSSSLSPSADGSEGSDRNPDWPFCSERCRLLDLDNWLSGRYRISKTMETADKAPNGPEAGRRIKGNRG